MFSGSFAESLHVSSPRSTTRATMDNILRAFEKCVASMLMTEQVLSPSNFVRTLCAPHPSSTLCAHHPHSLSHIACRGRPVAGFRAERRRRMPGASLLARTPLSKTTASVLPGRRTRPHVRGTDRLEHDAQGWGRPRVAGKRMFTCAYPFHRALPHSSPAVVLGSSGQQHDGHLFIPSEIAGCSGSRPGLEHETGRKYNTATR